VPLTPALQGLRLAS